MDFYGFLRFFTAFLRFFMGVFAWILSIRAHGNPTESLNQQVYGRITGFYGRLIKITGVWAAIADPSDPSSWKKQSNFATVVAKERKMRLTNPVQFNPHLYPKPLGSPGWSLYGE